MSTFTSTSADADIETRGDQGRDVFVDPIGYLAVFGIAAEIVLDTTLSVAA